MPLSITGRPPFFPKGFASNQQHSQRVARPKCKLLSPLNLLPDGGDELAIEVAVEFTHDPRELCPVMFRQAAIASDEVRLPPDRGDRRIQRFGPLRGQAQTKGAAVPFRNSGDEPLPLQLRDAR